MMKAVTTPKILQGIRLLAAAGIAVGGTVLLTPEPVTAQTIKLSIPPPPQNNVPAEVFTAKVKKFVDGETLQVERISPDGKPSGRTVLIHLYGVSLVPVSSLPRDAAGKNDKQDRGTRGSVTDLRESVVGRRVRVEVRGRSKLKNDQVAQNALVSILPNEDSALDAPPSLAQQGAPTIAVVQTRPLNDATGVNRDLPRGPSRPNLATSPNFPAPPPATPVRKDDVLNYALVREGLARWNQKEAPDVKEFSEAEEDARKSKRGLWAVAGK
jgi:endonuclease YncB( thermonuclease family)